MSPAKRTASRLENFSAFYGTAADAQKKYAEKVPDHGRFSGLSVFLRPLPCASHACTFVPRMNESIPVRPRPVCFRRLRVNTFVGQTPWKTSDSASMGISSQSDNDETCSDLRHSLCHRRSVTTIRSWLAERAGIYCLRIDTEPYRSGLELRAESFRELPHGRCPSPIGRPPPATNFSRRGEKYRRIFAG
jgi:hypothetical protein